MLTLFFILPTLAEADVDSIHDGVPICGDVREARETRSPACDCASMGFFVS